MQPHPIPQIASCEGYREMVGRQDPLHDHQDWGRVAISDPLARISESGKYPVLASAEPMRAVWSLVSGSEGRE